MSRLSEYQRQVTNGLFIGEGHDKLAHCALGLTGEAGEVADIVKKSQYATPKPVDPVKLLEELGDTLWYLTNIASLHGWTLEQVAAFNIAKLEERHQARQLYSYDRLLAAGEAPVQAS